MSQPEFIVLSEGEDILATDSWKNTLSQNVLRIIPFRSLELLNSMGKGASINESSRVSKGVRKLEIWLYFQFFVR